MNLYADRAAIADAAQANSITNAMLAPMAANGFKGQSAGGGNVQDLTPTQATAALNAFSGDSGVGGAKGLVPAPAAGDAAAGKVLGAAGGWVAPSAFLGATNPGGRLTLQAGVPFMPTTQAAQTVVYYAPYVHGYVPIYDGSTFSARKFISGPTDTTGLALTLGSNWPPNTIHDVFVTMNAGVPTLCTVQWTNSTTPADTLARYNGILTNAGAETCRTSNTATISLAVNQGTFLGAIKTDGAASSVSWTYGGLASGGSLGAFQVWNQYNRILTSSYNFDTGAAYTYTSTTVRFARGSGNNAIGILVGRMEDAFYATYQQNTQTVAVAGATTQSGICIDTNVVSAGTETVAPTANAFKAGMNITWAQRIVPGFHNVFACEQGDGANANSWAVYGGAQLIVVFPM
ncbi:MAG: hypothetical protein ACR650_09860 [Methylocystis sp.]